MVATVVRNRRDCIGIAWIVVLAALLLSPALKDGHNFGPADSGSRNSVLTAGSIALESHCLVATGAVSVAPCAHNAINGDIITQAVPWNTTDWELVHHGQFPLWEADAGTGQPQFLNFESAVLALPTIAGYLVPLSWSFLVTMFIKLLVAGLGAYWCARVFGARPSAAALGGASFMFSGALAGWLGWAISGPLVWTGAIVAAAVLAYRTPGRTWPPFALAVSVAFAIFGGFPENYALLAITLGALFVAAGVATLLGRSRLDVGGIVRGLAGIVGGLALSAVLWLPGLSVLPAAVRGGQVAATGRPLADLALLFAPGFDGLPVAGSAFFGNANYFETAASVAIPTIALAITALMIGRRRVAVVGIGGMALVALLLSYRLGPISPVQRLVIDLGMKSVNVSRAIALVGFAISVLGALGAEMLLARARERSVRRAFEAAVGAVVVVIVILGIETLHSGLVPSLVSLRRQSMLWPIATTVFLVAVVGAIELANRDQQFLSGRSTSAITRSLPCALVLVASAAGLFAEVGINSYSHMAYPKTQATEQLTTAIGTSLLGLDGGNTVAEPAMLPPLRRWTGTGLYPNMNVAYGVDELAMHDPTISGDYFAAWPVAGADGAASLNLFAPDVDSVALARRYGVRFILSAGGRPAIPGTTPVATIAGEVVSRVPDSRRFTIGTSRVPLSATHPKDTTYVVNTAGQTGQLTARITASPGWRASADGHRLPITRVDGATAATGVFLSVQVPPGTAAVTFHYTPPHFALALVVALIALIAFVASAIVRRRRESPVA